MRPMLLGLLGGLVFLMTLTLAQEILGLDPVQMRTLVGAFLGIDPESGYGWNRSPGDLLAYLLAAAVAGANVFALGRLMYRRS